MKKLEINKNDLQNNIDIIKKIASKTENNGRVIIIIAVVKANGVGLDIVKYSKILIENGINTLAVATLEEAIKLKEAGIENEIIMLTPIVSKNELQLLIENDITLTVSSSYQIELIEQIADELQKEEIRVHIKIDTGLARFGILYDNIQAIIQIFENAKRVKVARNVYTFFKT